MDNDFYVGKDVYKRQILNQDPRFHINMSPFFVAFVAFCFSMTVGVVWEFFEFGMDQIFGMDMQKDFIVNAIHSATLNPNGLNGTVSLNGITSTIVNYNGGQYVIEGGYLDVGIIDTMKDLMVNCIGAVVFSIIGILYIKHRGKGKIAKSFIPLMKTTEEIEETQKMIEEFKSKKRRNKNEKVKLNVCLLYTSDYIFSVPECREFFKYNRCVFFGVYRFTGKRGFVCCEVVRCDKTAVCGNKIACRYYKYITGNNVRGRNIKLIAVSEYTGMG